MNRYLSIIRLPNLVIMAMSMFLIRYAVIKPILEFNNLYLEQPLYKFALLVVSIILLAAGGNVINDIKDVDADKINKPKINVVRDLMSNKTAFNFYYSLTTLGLITGFLVAYTSGFLMLFVIHVVIGLSLWMYSNRLNNIPIVGNALVSALLASLPWIVFLFDLPTIILSQINTHSVFILPGDANLNFTSYFSILVFIILAYSLFVYLQNMAREITKDIIDIEGDASVGYRTGATVFGINNSKKLIRYSLLMLGMVYLGFLFLIYKFFVPPTGYAISITLLIIMGLLLFVPLIISYFSLDRAMGKEDFIQLSRWNKISQLIGLLTTLYFYFI